MLTTDTQQLLERLASLLRTELRGRLTEYGLQPVHFEALHYLSICNRYSDTPMGVTEYLGQTKGTVSQSLKVLEKKGFIDKVPDKLDKRMAHMKVTKSGRKVVQSLLPSSLLKSADDQLGVKGMEGIKASLSNLLIAMQQANGLKTFGQCLSCRHLGQEPSGEHFCGLTKESLSKKDIELICRENEPSH